MDNQKLSTALVGQILRVERQDKNRATVHAKLDRKIIPAQDDRLFGVLTFDLHFRDGLIDRVVTKSEESDKVAA